MILEFTSSDNLYSMMIQRTEPGKNRYFPQFFQYGMEKNLFVEYDIKNNSLVFSKDDADVVTRRIFGDLEKLNLPEINGYNTGHFITYSIIKMDGLL